MQLHSLFAGTDMYRVRIDETNAAYQNARSAIREDHGLFKSWDSMTNAFKERTGVTIEITVAFQPELVFESEDAYLLWLLKWS